MEGVEDDVDVALTWNALQDAAAVGVATVARSNVINMPPTDGEGAVDAVSAVDENSVDEDVADFVQLGGLPPYAHAVGNVASTLHRSDKPVVSQDGSGLIPSAATAPLSMAVASRFKRKNFSKHLQFLCLQRYADHVQTQGTLPDRSECQQLLHQSFAQFVREGGSADHPRLSYPEFLKLIRNRSRERQERRSRASAMTQQIHRQSLSSTTTHVVTGSLSSQSSGQMTTSRTSSRKRKWTEEVAKIDALIEVIDKARQRATTSAFDSHIEHTAVADRRSCRHQKTVRQVSTGCVGNMPNDSVAVTSASASVGSVVGSVASSDLVDSILKLQQQTLSLQHVIKERLESIQEQCHHHEPASASV